MAAMRRAHWIKTGPIAHRGFHDLNRMVWENTATAFDRAMHRGFAIECDLQMSPGGVPIVVNDYVLRRLCGVDAEVKNIAATDPTSMRVGTTDDQILTLEQMLSRVNGATGLVIELKPSVGRHLPDRCQKH